MSGLKYFLYFAVFCKIHALYETSWIGEREEVEPYSLSIPAHDLRTLNSSTEPTPENGTSSMESDSAESYPERLKELCQPYNLARNFSDIRKYLVRFRPAEEVCLAMALCRLQSTIGSRCPAFVDKLGTCFHETELNSTAYNVCPHDLQGIPYHPDNVSRECLANGSWGAKTDYSACRPIIDEGMVCKRMRDFFESKNKTKIYGKESLCETYLGHLTIISYVGRSLSMVSLIAAFAIFWKLRSIRCRRNVIHWNLTASLILRNLMWILLHLLIGFKSRRLNTVACRILVTVFDYSQITNYFWMLVEGLYLHVMVVMAYSHNRVKLRYYFIIGWVFPLPFVVVWALLKALLDDHNCWMPVYGKSSTADDFFQVPIIFILLINTVILANIVRILFTKLRSPRDGLKEEAARFKKAVKAAFFLFPLLGFTYIVFLISPEEGTTGQIVFLFSNVILQSFQGFFVCSIYCFANAEIQNAIAKKLRSWEHHGRIPCLRSQTKRIRRSSNSFSRSTFTTVNYRNKTSEERRNSKTNLSLSSPKADLADSHLKVRESNEEISLYVELQ